MSNGLNKGHSHPIRNIPEMCTGAELFSKIGSPEPEKKGLKRFITRNKEKGWWNGVLFSYAKLCTFFFLRRNCENFPPTRKFDLGV